MPSLQTLLKRGFTPTLESVNQFFLYLSQTQKLNYIISFFSQVNSNQIKANSQTRSFFTWALLKLHKFEEAEHFIKNKMAKTSNSCKKRLWDSLIQGFCNHRKDPEKALLVLQDCLKNHGMVPSSLTFCSLIHSLSSQGNMTKAIEVLELMTNERYPFDNFVCSSVITGFCKIGKPELALQFFENAMSSGVLRPNTVTYTTLVSSLRMLGRVNEVCNLVCRMEKEGLAFDVVFYSSWICGYFEEGELVEAFRTSSQMVEKGINPDTISFTILVDGFSKEGHVEKAVGILHKMIKGGLNPTLVTYTTILMGFCRKGKLEQALTLFKKVEDMGTEIDEFMYATLIDGVCRWGYLDLVFCLLNDMEKKGIKPSIVTYNTVINGLCKVGRTSEADEITKGLHGDAITYSTLLHGYVQEEDMQGILKTKRRLEEAGFPMDIVVFNILIKALFMVGAFEDIHVLYKTLPEMGLVADSITYCTLTDGFCKVGRIEEALEVFDKFRRTTFSSVACYNCIINGLCKNGMVDMAIEVFIELSEKGLPVDVGICRMLVEATFAEGMKGALNLVCRIENLGADVYDFLSNYILCFLCKRGFPEAAGELCMLMKKKGSVIQGKSYYSVLRGLIDGKEKSIIRPLLNVFVKEYGLVEHRVCMILLRYLCLKDVNSAFYFLAKLKERISTVTFPISVFRALVNAGKVLDAYKLVMEAEDFLPIMNEVDYSFIVDRLCKGGHPREALDVCSFAKNNGVRLNLVTYNSVINGLCCQGCLVEAFQLFDSLERIDLIPSVVTYAILIDNLCKQGLLLDAKQLFERMDLKGLKPNARVYNSLIDGYCKFGQVEKALKLLSDMELKSLKPDEFTVSAMMNCCYWQGDMEMALKCFDEFKSKGRSPDFLGYLYLVKGLCTKGRMEEARSILREMLQSKPVTELINQVDTEVELESVESLLIFLCEQGSIQEAVAILDEIGSIIFPSRRQHIPYFGLQTVTEINECRTSAMVDSRSVISCPVSNLGSKSLDLKKVKVVVDNYNNVGKSYQFSDFGFYYSLIASSCSKGEMEKANKLAREMLSSLAGNH